MRKFEIKSQCSKKHRAYYKHTSPSSEPDIGSRSTTCDNRVGLNPDANGFLGDKIIHIFVQSCKELMAQTVGNIFPLLSAFTPKTLIPVAITVCVLIAAAPAISVSTSRNRGACPPIRTENATTASIRIRMRRTHASTCT